MRVSDCMVLVNLILRETVDSPVLLSRVQVNRAVGTEYTSQIRSASIVIHPVFLSPKGTQRGDILSAYLGKIFNEF